MGNRDSVTVSFDSDGTRVSDDVLSEQYFLYHRIHFLITVQARIITGLLALITPFLITHFQYHLVIIETLSPLFTSQSGVFGSGVSVLGDVLLHEFVVWWIVSFGCWAATDKLLYPIRIYYFNKHSIPPEEFGLVFEQ